MKYDRCKYMRVVINNEINRLVKNEEIVDVYKYIVFRNIERANPDLDLDFETLRYNNDTNEWHINTKNASDIIVTIHTPSGHSQDVKMDSNMVANPFNIMEELMYAYKEYEFDLPDYNEETGKWFTSATKKNRFTKTEE